MARYMDDSLLVTLHGPVYGRLALSYPVQGITTRLLGNLCSGYQLLVHFTVLIFLSDFSIKLFEYS